MNEDILGEVKVKENTLKDLPSSKSATKKTNSEKELENLKILYLDQRKPSLSSRSSHADQNHKKETDTVYSFASLSPLSIAKKINSKWTGKTTTTTVQNAFSSDNDLELRQVQSRQIVPTSRAAINAQNFQLLTTDVPTNSSNESFYSVRL